MGDCPTGVGLIVALKKAVVWGTAVVLGALNGILILDDTLSKDQPQVIDDSRGQWAPGTSDKAQIALEGDLPMYARYDGVDLAVAMGCGSTGGAPVIIGDGPGYTQRFIPVEDTEGIFATFAKKIGVYVKEYPAVKFNGMGFKSETGTPAILTFPLIANDEVNDSAVNTTTTMANVTIPEEGLRILHSQSTVLINDQDGDALDSDDEVAPIGIELLFVGTRSGTYDRTDSKNQISEPCPDGKPTFILNLTFAKTADNQNFLDFQTDTPKKLEITFTGPEIETGVDYEFKFSFPFAKIEKPDAQTQEGLIQETVSFVLLEAAAAPTGMDATTPFYLDVQNTESADVLA